MHTSTKLLMGMCAAAFVASSAAAQSTDTSNVRIRVTKEGAQTRTGSASGVLGTSSSPSSPTNLNSNCTGVNCARADSLNSSAASAACTGTNCTANSSGCVGTTCTGNANMNANACTGSNCNPNPASGNTLVPSNAGTMTAAGDLDTAMFGAPDLTLLQGMSEANILAHLAMGDSMEIRMAQHALQQTQDPRVRDFANTLIADHTRSLQEEQTIAQQAGITPQLAVGDTAGMRMMDHMNMNMSMSMSAKASDSTSATMGNMNMSGQHRMMAYSDANFIRHNVFMHRHMLTELQSLQGAARSDAVRNKISSTIPVVQKHLATAQQLATDLNVDLNARMKMGGMAHPPTR